MTIKDKLKSYNFWITLVSALILLLQIFGNKFNFKVDSQFILDVTTALCSIFVILGIISVPKAKTNKTTTGTITDTKVEEKVIETEDLDQQNHAVTIEATSNIKPKTMLGVPESMLSAVIEPEEESLVNRRNIENSRMSDEAEDRNIKVEEENISLNLPETEKQIPEEKQGEISGSERAFESNEDVVITNQETFNQAQVLEHKELSSNLKDESSTSMFEEERSSEPVQVLQEAEQKQEEKATYNNLSDLSKYLENN